MTDRFRAHLGDTPLTDDEKQGLIPSITTQRELNEFEFANIMSGRDWALSRRRLAKAETRGGPPIANAASDCTPRGVLVSHEADGERGGWVMLQHNGIVLC